MAVTKPPELKNKYHQYDIEELIDRGAKVKEDNKQKTQWVNLNLRIPSKMLDEVSKEKNERVGISRTGWILEAIQEKLKRIKE